MGESDSEALLRAVDVRRIRGSLLSGDDRAGGIAAEELPTELFDSASLPFDRSAVVSWRWDREPRTGRSLNTALALKYAQESEIEFVFIDTVTIDQTLPAATFRQSVADLARLYRALPVIAAYDQPATDLRDW